MILNSARERIVKSHKGLVWNGWWSGLGLGLSLFLFLDKASEGDAWALLWLAMIGLNIWNIWMGLKNAKTTANLNISTVQSQADSYIKIGPNARAVFDQIDAEFADDRKKKK